MLVVVTLASARLDVILVKEFDFVQKWKSNSYWGQQLWELKWPRHLNSIVAFFMRFLFLFNLLVPFFRPLYCFPSPSSPSLVCMTNMLFFSTLTSVLGLQETVCVSVWLSVCAGVCV